MNDFNDLMIFGIIVLGIIAALWVVQRFGDWWHRKRND